MGCEFQEPAMQPRLELIIPTAMLVLGLLAMIGGGLL
jgi:hypothetical protein